MRNLIALVFLMVGLHLPVTTSSVNAAEQALDHASLKTLLEGMGYEPTEANYSDTGASFWQLQFDKGRWKYDLAINANSQDNVYLSLAFGLYKGSVEGIPQSVLLGLLSENANLTWSHYRYQPASKSFFLISALRNKNITAIYLRRAIEEMIAAADRTQKYWDPKQWPNKSSTEPATGTVGEAKK